MLIIDITPIGAYLNAIQVARGRDCVEAARTGGSSWAATASVPPEREPLRSLSHCYQRAAIRLYGFVRLAAEFASSRAAPTSVIIAVVLPTLLWWIV